MTSVVPQMASLSLTQNKIASTITLKMSPHFFIFPLITLCRSESMVFPLVFSFGVHLWCSPLCSPLVFTFGVHRCFRVQEFLGLAFSSHKILLKFLRNCWFLLLKITNSKNKTKNLFRCCTATIGEQIFHHCLLSCSGPC